MYFKSLLFLCLLFFFVKSQKPGDCPRLLQTRVCNENCFVDTHCPGNLKCCSTACGGSFCIRPIAIRGKQEKAGSCPERPSGPWVCSSRCSADSDCRGSKKCCKNRCGATACTKPEL